MKAEPEYIEGPKASARMDAATRKMLSVPREEMQRREAEYRAKVDANPNRRGPKRKGGAVVSPRPSGPTSK